MSMDPWYLLKCPSCRATLRIKSAYVHMQGNCPVCNTRIQAPIPKPLSFTDEPVVLQDEMWPEPPELLSEKKSDEQTYQLRASTESKVAKPVDEEEDAGGTYSLAFDPDEPKGPGITRSAEWDQANTPTVTPVSPAPVVTRKVTPPVEIPVTPPVIGFKTEIDPLFGDEVKVQIAEKPAPQVTEPAVQQPVLVPVARLATPEELGSLLAPAIPLPPEPPLVPQKKKKKKDDVQGSSESYAYLNKPTEETHLYRLSEAEENRIKPDAPPESVFIDGVFGFPWQLKNLGAWIWLSLYFCFNFTLLWLIQYVINVQSMYSAIGAGAIGMALLFVSIFTFSFGCACWSNTITYTAAGSHAVNWETDGWRENVVIMLRIGYYVVIAMMMATPLLVLNAIGIGSYLWIMGTLFLFPVFLFSGMASLTFWNFMHGEVIKKFIAKGHYYLAMYGISVALFFIASVAVYFSMEYLPLVLFAGPLYAAVWLIYGRLLGRMAYLLQQEPKKKKKKKKKKKVVDEAAQESEEAEELAAVATTNEKGPREDARGPGGARPV